MHRFDSLKIAVAGTGYVGLSLATLLSQHHQVTAVDIIPEKVEKINKRISPIQDEYIEKGPGPDRHAGRGEGIHGRGLRDHRCAHEL